MAIPHQAVAGDADIVVRYRFPLYLSYIFWLFGWIILFNLLAATATSPIPKNSPGLLFDFVFWAAIIFVIGLGGPIAATKYSLSVYVSNQQITIKRFFGLRTKYYRTVDAIRFDVSPARKRSIPRVTVTFLDGDQVSISAYALGFQLFCDFMSVAVTRK